MCRFLSKLLSSCCHGFIPYCCLLVFLLFAQNISAQIVAIEDPIGIVIPTDTTNNPDPTNSQNGSELSTLSPQQLATTITTKKITLQAGPDQKITQLVLLNTSGQLVFAATPNESQFTSTFGRELKGVHILIVQSTQGVLRQKLFLQP